MNEVLENAELLIEKLKKEDFVKNIVETKNIIISNNLLDIKDINELHKNDVIHKYIENVNELDLYIYYINTEIKKLINNKVCRSNNESN